MQLPKTLLARLGHPLRLVSLFAISLTLLALWPRPGRAGQLSVDASKGIVYVPGPRPGGLGPLPDLPERGDLRARITRPKTWRALRDEGVVRQGWDYSCGSAALATLFSDAGQPISEKEILLEALSGLSPEQEKRTLDEGLSLLDLRKVAQARGYRAAGYRVGPEMLEKLTRPVLVFIRPQGYRHFAVLRGLRGDRVFLADPARGNVRMPLWQFLRMWEDEQGQGVVFAVGADTPAALELAADVPTHPELAATQRILEAGARSFRPPVER